MRKVILTSLIVMMVAGATWANPEGVCEDGKLIGHLKIIGVKDPKSVKMEDKDNGNVIFVLLGAENEPANTEIYLIQGDDFAVLDKNGTDGEAAYMLPPTGLEAYVLPADEPKYSAYSVFLRPLGTPGGKASIVTCAEFTELFGDWIKTKTEKDLLALPEGTICSMEQVSSEILVRNTGKSKFINVTAELLTILYQVTVVDEYGVESLIYVRVPIFSDLLEGEFWNYDNEGLKNLDVRFYDCPTDVTEGDPEV
jgi:hypothetical protein